MKRSHPLALFAPWHLLGALGKAAAPLAIFAMVGALPIWFSVRSQGLALLQAPGRGQDFLLSQYHGGLTISLALGAIILMSGGASLDRERQHVRFLFSRPVAPWQFYLQQFVLSSLLFALAVSLIPLLMSWLVIDVPVVAVFLSALLFALVYGSLGFLCGALLNRDGIAFIGIMVLSQVLQAAKDSDALGPMMSALATALPPLFAAGGIRADLFAGRAVDMGDLRLVIGYSLAMLVAALVAVRLRPLVR